MISDRPINFGSIIMSERIATSNNQVYFVPFHCCLNCTPEESSLPTNHQLVRCDRLRIRVNAGGLMHSYGGYGGYGGDDKSFHLGMFFWCI